MITDQQVRKLRRLDRQGLAKEVAAARIGMDAKTARKYRRLGKLPSEVMIMDRDWRTRPDAFAEFWPELEAKLTRLAAETGGTAYQVALDLLASSIDHDEWFRTEVEKGRAAAGEGRLLEHDDVAARIEH